MSETAEACCSLNPAVIAEKGAVLERASQQASLEMSPFSKDLLEIPGLVCQEWLMQIDLAADK